ncbi:hypothetical protein LCGC14_0632520 [marine sediment metagenome]|uniref:Uncharacterized protein n=1 Tax=marine sediment metagenome TaxID=412755 RepID=A0A0F9RKV4_9ZZZZ
MKRRDWLIMGIGMCYNNFLISLSFLLYFLTMNWIYFLILPLIMFSFLFPMLFEEESEYY